MGRVQKQPKQTQVLFPAPADFVIEGKPETKALTQVETHRTRTNDPEISNVRLNSSRNPVNRRYLPQFVKYAMTTQPTLMEIEEYLVNAELNGYGVGSVVARRWGIKENWAKPQMWGLIFMVRDIHVNPNTRYAPFLVKWFNNQEAESAWAEDLIVIHHALSDSLIVDIVEMQGVRSELYDDIDEDDPLGVWG